MESTAKEGQAKGMLLKNGVNIYESSETKAGQTALKAEASSEEKTVNSSETTESSSETTETTSEEDISAASDKEDENHSHGQAPNGLYYSNNDWDFLASTGNYTEEEIKQTLDECNKYKKNEDSANSTTEQTDSNTKVEDVSKKKEPFIKIDKDVLDKAADDLVMNLADSAMDKITSILR